MEASIAVEFEPTASVTEETPPSDLLSWWAELERELPEGEGLTDDMLRVDYLLEQVAKEEASRAGVEEFTARRVAMVREHGEREMDRHTRRIRYLHARIAMHMPPSSQGFRETFAKKSVSLPHGEVGFSASRESLVVNDTEAALEFAKANKLPVKVEISVGKTPLMEHFKKTGEVPDGCEVVPGKDSFFVRAKGDA